MISAAATQSELSVHPDCESMWQSMSLLEGGGGRRLRDEGLAIRSILSLHGSAPKALPHRNVAVDRAGERCRHPRRPAWLDARACASAGHVQALGLRGELLGPQGTFTHVCGRHQGGPEHLHLPPGCMPAWGNALLQWEIITRSSSRCEAPSSQQARLIQIITVCKPS